MSNFSANEDETEFSLTKAVEDVSVHGCAQTAALKEKQKILSSLQSTLKDVEMEEEIVQQDLRAKVRDTLLLEGEIEHLEQQIKVLRDRCVSFSKENCKLQTGVIEEEEASAHIALEMSSTYRKKMEGHRAAVLHATSQTEAQRELEEKRELVRMLTQKKEELKEDLENPDGNTVQMEKREIDALNEEISERRESLEEKREKLHQEFELHTQIKKDIEIQNRRYEAIVRRLHCQMSRAQAVHRQLSDDIYHLERQLEELKRQQGSSQDSAAADH
ncbi:coiled-coil domain-containing protein 122-like [Labrus mixtus]|uniref:coiled-coil domain-containing protein 122-like n=1 Tax=Labrus mixtus TaxID=508554 RepID=UPI0029C0FABA|nr:coiled-coil domain-containing protein 122-like [Labrus mixtus]